ncbi:MAG: bifunctional chorismate mutase/prephenate dehydratase [Lachnospiraceae bacterium]|nr:bifunctional chorismate mutase/prephenate dehydratase [Lachnospiraceae bacterium]
MPDLQQLREEIDQVDRQLAELFEKRQDICRLVAEYKIENQKKVLDRERERQKLLAVESLAKKEENRHGLRDMFAQLMAASRKLQYRVLAENGQGLTLPFEPVDSLDRKAPVVFQGVPGAYSQLAAMKYFGEDARLEAVRTWEDAMKALSICEAGYAVLPIENSTAGSVDGIYDLLGFYDNYIVGEIYLKVEHALLGLPEAELSDIRVVYSHPQGLMQCAPFLNSHPQWKQMSVNNTALSAKKVREDGDLGQAAVASPAAAKIYGLKVLKEGVNYSDVNTTRFIIVAGRKIFQRDAGKISICFEVPHESGSLYSILSHFIYNDLNMTKIESCPIAGRNWEYRFFVDFDGNLLDPAVLGALRGIMEEAGHFKILGNY